MTKLLVLLLLLLSPSRVFRQVTVLEVTVRQASSDKGLVRILVFSSEKGFPSDPKRALKSFSVKPKAGKCVVKIEGLPLGTYAISVIHDEDENGKLNTNLVGYPLEKYGFSNNPKTTFGPPGFDKAAIELKAEPKKVEILLR